MIINGLCGSEAGSGRRCHDDYGQSHNVSAFTTRSSKRAFLRQNFYGFERVTGKKKKSHLFHSRARLNHPHSRLFRRSVSSQKHICYSCMPPVLIGIHLKRWNKQKQNINKQEGEKGVKTFLWANLKRVLHWSRQVLTTVQLIRAVSAVVDTITFPEHGLTQSIFTSDILGIALWRGNTFKLICCGNNVDGAESKWLKPTVWSQSG